MADQKKSLSRREFLQRLGISTAGVILAAHTGNHVWNTVQAANDPADGPEDPEEDPRNIDNATEVNVSAMSVSKELTDEPPTLSDGTVVNGKLAPAWQDGVKITIRQTEKGKFLAWTVDTNPVWMWAGEEADNLPHQTIRWSQPEIAGYDNDPTAAIRYNGFAKSADSLSLTTTINDIPYGQAIPSATLTQLQQQQYQGALVQNGLAFENIAPAEAEFDLPEFPSAFSGFTLETWFKVTGTVEILTGDGYSLSFDDDTQTFSLQWGDQTATSAPMGSIIGDWHHMTVIVDAGPRMIAWLIDDNFSWTGYIDELYAPAGSHTLHLSTLDTVELAILRVYNRPLRTAESVISYHYYGQGMGIYDYL